MNDRAETFDRMILSDDVPNLDVVGFLRSQFADQFSALFWRVDLDDRRIAEIELRTRNARDERPGDRDARSFRGRVGDLTRLEIPHRTADVDDAGDAGTQITREGVRQILLIIATSSL